jgi:hypothetical protein
MAAEGQWHIESSNLVQQAYPACIFGWHFHFMFLNLIMTITLSTFSTPVILLILILDCSEIHISI